jgi:hypothetical protein
LFEAVYIRQVFDHIFSCTKKDARQSWTVPQWLQATNDPYFEANTRENYNLHDEEAIEDTGNNGYFSNRSLPPDKKEEVSIITSLNI